MNTEQIGPTTIQVTVQVCGACFFHTQQHHGTVTTHHCQHPAAKSRFYGGGINGVRIGNEDRTPCWCPAIREKGA